MALDGAGEEGTHKRASETPSWVRGMPSQGCPEGGRPEQLLFQAKTAVSMPCAEPGCSVCTMTSRPAPLFMLAQTHGVNKVDFTSLSQEGRIQTALANIK